METIKETKYLKFDAYHLQGRKTVLVKVIDKSSGIEIATIEWYGAWRQYVFAPSLEFDTVWNNTCLTDVIAVIDQLMNERRIKQINKPEGE